MWRPSTEALLQSCERSLGTSCFRVVLLARMAQEAGWFDLQDVVAGISKKMVDRHPHVFGSGEEDRPGGSGGEADRIRAWEERKAQERESRASVLDGVPQAMPALLRAHKVSRKAAVVGFDWPDRDSVRKKVDEELEELDAALAAGDEAGTAEEFGDLLFTLVNLGRHLPSTAEDALRMATSKFETRFRRVEDALAAQGRSVHATPLEELEALWQAHKKEGRQTA